MTDAEILAALARNLTAIRDDAHKAALLMHLFGRRYHEAYERLRELGQDQPPVGHIVQVVELRLIRLA